MSSGVKKRPSAKQLERILEFLDQVAQQLYEQLEDLADDDKTEVIDLNSYREAKRLLNKAKEIRKQQRQ